MTQTVHTGIRHEIDEVAEVLHRVAALNSDEHRLYNITARWTDGDGWTLQAQSCTLDSDEAMIEDIRWWANQLVGEIHLDDARFYTVASVRRRYRELSARATIFGVSVEIWNHIDVREEPAPAALPTAA